MHFYFVVFMCGCSAALMRAFARGSRGVPMFSMQVFVSSPAFLRRIRRLLSHARRHKGMLAEADEILPPRFLERCTRNIPVLRHKILHQSALHGLFRRAFRDIHAFACARVEPRIVHAGGKRAGRRIKSCTCSGRCPVCFKYSASSTAAERSLPG